MTLPSQFELVLMCHPVLRRKDKRLLLVHRLLGLIVNAVLDSILGEVPLTMTHRLEHILMYDLTAPQLSFLFLCLLLPAIFVAHVSRWLVHLPLNLRSRICHKISWFSFHPSVLVPFRLFLSGLLLLDVRVGCAGA